MVAITADENALPVLSATLQGDTLRIGLDEAQTRSIVTSRLEARVTLPTVEAVNLSGGARLWLDGTAPQATELTLASTAAPAPISSICTFETRR